MTELSNTVAQEPSGIGGWLLLPVLATCVTPLLLLKSVVELVTFMGGADFAAAPDGLKLFILAETFVNSGMMFAWLYAAYTLFRKRRIFPGLFCALMAIGLAGGALDLVVAAGVFGIAPGNQDYADLLKQIIGAMIWIPYMVQSVRVKNTFTRD